MSKVKKIAAGVGTAVIVGGGALYLATPEEITYQEYKEILASYNAKVQEIKDDCDNDERCVKVNGKERVVFEGVRKKKDVKKKLDKWLEDDVDRPCGNKKDKPKCEQKIQEKLDKKIEKIK